MTADFMSCCILQTSAQHDHGRRNYADALHQRALHPFTPVWMAQAAVVGHSVHTMSAELSSARMACMAIDQTPMQ